MDCYNDRYGLNIPDGRIRGLVVTQYLMVTSSCDPILAKTQ